MSEPLYAAWKRGIVVEALRQHGIEAAVGALLRVPLAGRAAPRGAHRQAHRGNITSGTIAAAATSF